MPLVARKALVSRRAGSAVSLACAPASGSLASAPETAALPPCATTRDSFAGVWVSEATALAARAASSSSMDSRALPIDESRPPEDPAAGPKGAAQLAMPWVSASEATALVSLATPAVSAWPGAAKVLCTRRRLKRGPLPSVSLSDRSSQLRLPHDLDAVLSAGAAAGDAEEGLRLTTEPFFNVFLAEPALVGDQAPTGDGGVLHSLSGSPVRSITTLSGSPVRSITSLSGSPSLRF